MCYYTRKVDEFKRRSPKRATRNAAGVCYYFSCTLSACYCSGINRVKLFTASNKRRLYVVLSSVSRHVFRTRNTHVIFLLKRENEEYQMLFFLF